jgi:hypothetical protein
MHTALRRLLLVVVPVLFLGPVVAEASWADLPTLQSHGGRDGRGGRGDRGGGSRKVPEFDPSAVGAIAALIGGGAVLFSRSRKK